MIFLRGGDNMIHLHKDNERTGCCYAAVVYPNHVVERIPDLSYTVLLTNPFLYSNYNIEIVQGFFEVLYVVRDILFIAG